VVARITIRQKFQEFSRWFLPHYIHHRNYIGRGDAEIMTIRHIIYIILGFKIAFDVGHTAILVIAGFMFVGLMWMVGWWYDKNNGNQAQAEWTNKRDPFAKEVREKLKR
jgi:hypothetical protein